MSQALNDERLPVLIGAGEIVDRERDPMQALEPAALMAKALQSSCRDAAPERAAELLQAIDSLDVVSEHSWPYADICALLGELLGIAPRRAIYGVTGGETPVQFLHEAALRIASGESQVCAVVGAEAAYSVAGAFKTGAKLPWHARDPKAKLTSGRELCHPLAVAHGVFMPVHIYPFYENASQAAWGQTPAQALRESGDVWAQLAQIAAANPASWTKKTPSAEQIITPSADNRLICWPYTKHMVANPMVNQGAALIMTSRAVARSFGIADTRMVHIVGGAAAKEPRDYLQRDRYDRSAAQDAVMDAALSFVDGDATRYTQTELYSCFPTVPKMARRRLGLAADATLSATGGLSFFGAPLNNYMSHAAAALMRGLRSAHEASPAAANRCALLYGQGEFVTKHHALVLSASAPRESRLRPDYSVQAVADREMGSPPTLLSEYAGNATLETFTVLYGRDGNAEAGVVIARSEDGARLMARVPADDGSAIARLTDLTTTPVGARGQVRAADDGRLHWNFCA